MSHLQSRSLDESDLESLQPHSSNQFTNRQQQQKLARYIEPVRNHFPIYEDYRLLSGILLLPILIITFIVIIYNVKKDPDYQHVSDFIPLIWIIFLPPLILHIIFSIALAIKFPTFSTVILKYETHKQIPIPLQNIYLQLTKCFLFGASGLLQFVLLSFCAAMSIGHFLNLTVYDDSTAYSSWTLFWLYSFALGLYCVSTTLTVFGFAAEIRSFRHHKKYYNDDELSSNQTPVNTSHTFSSEELSLQQSYLPPQLDNM